MRTLKIAVIALSLVLIATGWYGYKLYKMANSFKAKTTSPIEKETQKQLETEATRITKDVDKNGLQHTVAQIVKSINPEEVDKVKADLLDTIDALNIARDKVSQVLAFNVTLTIENQELKRHTGLDETTYTFKDRNYDLSVLVPKDTSKKATFTNRYDADLVASQYNKRSGLFGNKPYIDIYSNDRRFTNQGIRTFTVKPKEPSVVIKTQVTSSYDFVDHLVFGGPALSVDLGNFNATGKYMLSPSGKQSRFQINGSYNFTRLQF
jgi:regulator of replication initiation timing